MAHKGARLQSLAWQLLHNEKEQKQGQEQEQEPNMHPVLSVVNRQPEVVTIEQPGQVVLIHNT